VTGSARVATWKWVGIASCDGLGGRRLSKSPFTFSNYDLGNVPGDIIKVPVVKWAIQKLPGGRSAE
jgi:hypothetical protein